MPGMHGMYWNNIAIGEADLVLGIGMRFDDRVTGRLKDFASKAKIVHIDIDPAEIGKNVHPTVPIVGDVKEVLRDLNPLVQPARHDQWYQHIMDIKREHPSIAIPKVDKVLPQYVIKKIYDLSPRDSYFVTGVGQHQMWAAQFFWGDNPASFITSRRAGHHGLRSACHHGRAVRAAEEHRLGDLRRRRLPDDAAGAGDDRGVRAAGEVCHHQQPPRYGAAVAAHVLRRQPTVGAVVQPDFVKLAEAYGMPGMLGHAEGRRRPPSSALQHRGPC
jgi:acetolactate synthase-1/2/3 large subunit